MMQKVQIISPKNQEKFICVESKQKFHENIQSKILNSKHQITKTFLIRNKRTIGSEKFCRKKYQLIFLFLQTLFLTEKF